MEKRRDQPLGGDVAQDEETPAGARILIVANRTASTPMLLKEVSNRARTGARFTLLIPPERSAHGEDWSASDAVGLLERASGDSVAYLDCGPDPLGVIHRAVDAGEVDEIILCTPPEHLTRWIHHDLRHRLEHLKLPVRVMPPDVDAPVPDHMREAMPESWSYPPPTPGIAGTY
jgi:hypothetical protein